MTKNLMIRKIDSSLRADEAGGVSPFNIEFFMVQGIDFKCMAYRDRDGRWRRAFFDSMLPDPIRILE